MVHWVIVKRKEEFLCERRWDIRSNDSFSNDKLSNDLRLYRQEKMVLIELPNNKTLMHQNNLGIWGYWNDVLIELVEMLEHCWTNMMQFSLFKYLSLLSRFALPEFKPTATRPTPSSKGATTRDSSCQATRSPGLRWVKGNLINIIVILKLEHLSLELSVSCLDPPQKPQIGDYG